MGHGVCTVSRKNHKKNGSNNDLDQDLMEMHWSKKADQRNNKNRPVNNNSILSTMQNDEKMGSPSMSARMPF